MMKKFTITLIFTILCGTNLFSQEIDRVTYEKWIDLVNCKYLEAYFDKKIDDATISQMFRNDYNNRVKKSLADVDFNNADSRVKILAPLKSYPNGKILIEFIENKKSDFDKNWDKSQLIEQLLALPINQPTGTDGSFNDFLKEEKANLKIYLQKELLPQNQQITDTQIFMSDSLQNTTAATATQQATNINNFISKISSPWAIVALCFIILIVLLLIFRRNITEKLQAKSPEKIAGTGFLEKLSQLEKDNQALTDKVFHISYKNDELRREIDKICQERDLAYQKIRELQNIKKKPNSLF
jgi:hypothetical protein